MREGIQHIHLGLCMVRVYGMHRKKAGTKVLIAVRDTRWGNDDRNIIGTIEIDMERGTQMTFMAPDMMMSIHDFFNHIELTIQTRGYENWEGAESNL